MKQFKAKVTQLSKVLVCFILMKSLILVKEETMAEEVESFLSLKMKT